MHSRWIGPCQRSTRRAKACGSSSIFTRHIACSSVIVSNDGSMEKSELAILLPHPRLFHRIHRFRVPWSVTLCPFIWFAEIFGEWLVSYLSLLQRGTTVEAER